MQPAQSPPAPRHCHDASVPFVSVPFARMPFAPTFAAKPS